MITDLDREKIKKAYPASKTWAAKVDKMSEGQLIAVLLKFKQNGLIKDLEKR
jgi:hypothetical protein